MTIVIVVAAAVAGAIGGALGVMHAIGAAVLKVIRNIDR